MKRDLGEPTPTGKPFWNYRVVRKGYVEAGENCESLAIHEVYYDACGKPDGVTQDPCDLSTFGGGLEPARVEDLLWHLMQMRMALRRPTLEYDCFRETEARKPTNGATTKNDGDAEVPTKAAPEPGARRRGLRDATP